MRFLHALCILLMIGSFSSEVLVLSFQSVGLVLQRNLHYV